MSSDQEKTEDLTASVSVDEPPSADSPTFRLPSDLPVLPLRDTVLFPNSFMPLAVARESSVRLIDEAVSSGSLIAVFTQREAGEDEPLQDDLYPVGTASHIHKMFKLPDGSLRIIVQGLARVRMTELVNVRPYLRAKIEEALEALGDRGLIVADDGPFDQPVSGSDQQVCGELAALVGFQGARVTHRDDCDAKHDQCVHGCFLLFSVRASQGLPDPVHEA